MKNTKILYNMPQNLTEAQKQQARDNLGITGSLPTPPGSGMILSTDSDGDLAWMPKYTVKYPDNGIIHIESDNTMWVGAFYNNPVNGSLSGATLSSGKWVYNIPVPSPRNYAFGSCWLQVWPYVNGARTNNAKVAVMFDLYLKEGGRHSVVGANNAGLRLEDSVAGYVAESRGKHMFYIENFYNYDHIEVTIDRGDLQGTEDMRLDYQFVFDCWMPGGY